MNEIFRYLLGDRSTGTFSFGPFTFCHIIYLVLTAVIISLTIYLYRNKSQEAKQKLVERTITTAFGLYMLDLFLMPLAYGHIDIYKLPFHICTAMSIMCMLSRFNKRFAKFNTAFTIMGLVGALMYMTYPSGVLDAEGNLFDGYTYRIVQTVIYHGLMIAYGVFSIAFKEIKLDLKWKSLKYDLISIASLALIAFVANHVYTGHNEIRLCECNPDCMEIIVDRATDFNWFFVKHDALFIIPDNIDIYIAPFAMVAVIFGMCTLIRLIGMKSLQLVENKKNKASL